MLIPNPGEECGRFGKLCLCRGLQLCVWLETMFRLHESWVPGRSVHSPTGPSKQTRVRPLHMSVRGRLGI